MPTIYINLDYFLNLGNMPFPLMLARLFLDGGWILVLIVLIQGGWTMWVQSRNIKYNRAITYCLLAIDVPKMNEQTPKAVEQIFSQVAGAYSGFDNIEKYWLGKTQATFSFEIVSIDGYVQFLVHCAVRYRDLIEAAFYAQYPEAEIVEVADYTTDVPATYPDPEWDAWGTEFALKKPSAFPLRTYIQFEHSPSEFYFKDPISPLLEVMSSMKAGERLWYQILISPSDDSWKDASKELVNKIIGKKIPPKLTILDHAVNVPLTVLSEIGSAVMSSGEAPPPKKPEAGGKITDLTPGERGLVEQIQLKASKHGFNTKLRMVYVGKRGVFNKGKVIAAFKGALGIFTALDSNGLKPYGKVTPKSDYFWERWSVPKKTSAIVRNYRNRSGKGATAYILNVEELATLYHFPFMQVKAPLVKKTEAKRGEPPVALPTQNSGSGKPFKPAMKKPAAPAALPVVPVEPELPGADEELELPSDELPPTVQ